MRIPGKTMNDHLADVARQFPEGSFTDMQDVECNADIYPSQVFLEFRTGFDRENPHRPYMHIMGECRGIRKADGTPLYGDVTELSFEENAGIEVDVFYEFSDDELADMVKKGMYHRGFECPDIIRESELEIPVYCELRIVEPQFEGDVPILFANIEDRHTISIDEQSSGYTFGDYFEEPRPSEDVFSDDFGIYGEYGDFEDEDMFGEDAPQTDLQEEQEAVELSPMEREVEEHYQNVRQRVMDEHVAPKAPVPHKELKPKTAEAEAEEQDEHVADDAAQRTVEDAKSFDERMDEAEAEAAQEEKDAVSDAPTPDEEKDGIDDFDDFEDFDEKRESAANKRRVAVEDNVEANAEDDAASGFEDFDDEKEAKSEDDKPVPAQRAIPASMAEVAEKASHQGLGSDKEYDE